MHHNHHEIRAMAREQEHDRLRETRAWSRGGQPPNRVPGTLKRMLAAVAAKVGIAPGGLIRTAFCRILGSTMRRVGFGLVRSGRRLARIA